MQSVFALSVQHQIHLEPECIPREFNERADYLSRIVDYDDWSLNPIVFEQLDALWGPHTVDRFASFHNHQLPRFNTRFWNPGLEAVDTFTVNWSGGKYWLCPPIHLVPRVICHAQVCRAIGTLHDSALLAIGSILATTVSCRWPLCAVRVGVL